MEKLNPEKIIGKKIGEGWEKTVYRHKHDKERVVGVFDKEHVTETICQIKSRFYLTKIFHILYPDNFPNLHLSASNPHIVVVDYVKGDAMAEKDILQALALETEVRNRTGVSMDLHRENFKKDEVGNWVYVDTLSAYHIIRFREKWQMHERFNEESLRYAISFLPEEEKKKALFYLSRLNKLVEEEKKELEKSSK